jgi:tRNA threonylcarbamoyladenosine biosynthesis protein TsaE
MTDAFHLADEAALMAWGARLAPLLRAGDCIALSGGLGAGKTTLARGVLRGLDYHGDVPSPSFALLQAYEPPDVPLPLAHVDLYRVDDPSELAELGLDEWRGSGILMVEWPERLGPTFLAQALAVQLDFAADGGRDLTARVPEGWTARWPFL